MLVHKCFFTNEANNNVFFLIKIYTSRA